MNLGLKEDIQQVVQKLVNIPPQAVELPNNDETFIDPQSYMGNCQELIDAHECSICLGVVQLPAVMCVECNKTICKDTCYANMNSNQCPQRCKTLLNQQYNVPIYVRKQLRESNFKCNENKCTSYGKHFIYDDYILHIKEHASIIKVKCPLKCGKELTKDNLKSHLEISYDDFFQIFGFDSVQKQTCQMLQVICIQCNQKMSKDQMLNHQCLINAEREFRIKLYQQHYQNNQKVTIDIDTQSEDKIEQKPEEKQFQEFCYICHKNDQEESQLVCDLCDFKSAHYTCLGFTQIPQDEWFCHTCKTDFKKRFQKKKPLNLESQLRQIFELDWLDKMQVCFETAIPSYITQNLQQQGCMIIDSLFDPKNRIHYKKSMTVSNKMVVYEGQINNDQKREGIGRALIFNKAKNQFKLYEGQFKRGIANGWGRTFNRNEIYIGQYKNSLWHGKGKRIDLITQKVQDGYWNKCKYLGNSKPNKKQRVVINIV